jgi:hypothetical protein
MKGRGGSMPAAARGDREEREKKIVYEKSE